MSGGNKEKRVDDALKALVATFLADPEGSASTEEDIRRQQDELSRTLRGPLRRGMWAYQDSSYDVSTVIRRQLAQTGRGSDAAVRFGNIYSRLMALPIINNKAGILDLLQRLSASEFEDDDNVGDDGGFVNDLPMQPFRREGVNDGGGRSPQKQHQHQHQHQQQQHRQQQHADESQQESVRLQTRNQTPFDRPRTNLTEATSARIHRQSTEMSAPKTPREAYARSNGMASRQQQPTESATYSPSRAAGVPVSPEGVEEPSVLPSAPIDRSPTEASLLRDLPFVLQGLSTSNLVFSAEEEGSSKLVLPAELPLPLISILHTLAEPSLLYRRLATFARSSQKGLVLQSLQAAVETQLRAYLGLISTLEAEIRRCLASPDAGNGDNAVRGAASPDGADGEDGRPQTAASRALAASRVGVTLKRCVLWTHDATLGLRLLVSIAEQAESGRLKGGSLISLVHRLADANGDPFVSGFAGRMLGHLTRPFYDMLRQWIYDGELRDPYGEFFVYEVDPEDGNNGNEKDRDADNLKKMLGTSVWDNKYKMNGELVPTIIDGELAKKVFLIGKSLNFIRYSCGDSGWVEQYSKEHSRELTYGDTAALGSSIDIAYKTTMAHLIHLLDAKFGLFSHLEALKRYLLLGQGDFVVLLIESLASNLDKPAGTQYRHTLTAQLDHAIRGSNAQFDNPEILRRLDARLLEMTHGEIGWDVFTLEYKVDAPCDVVVTSWANRQYLSVFNLLWRIKRIEFALGGTWRRVTTGARTVLAQMGGDLRRRQPPASSLSSASSSSHSADLTSDWKAARCTLSAMVHFVTQLQYFIMVEVVEASWNKLQEDIRKDGVTLDDMTEAHTRYLRTITHRALLGGAKHSVTGNRDDAFPAQLHRLLKAILAYSEAIDGLYAYSVAEYTKQQQEAAAKATASAAKRRPHGGWSGEEEDLDPPLAGGYSNSRSGPGGWEAGDVVGGGGGGLRTAQSIIPGLGVTDEDTMLPALRKRMMELSSEFKTRLETLLGDLLMHPDQELRFLSVAMNYNDVYKPVRRKRRREKDKERERSTEHLKDKERAESTGQ